MRSSRRRSYSTVDPSFNRVHTKLPRTRSRSSKVGLKKSHKFFSKSKSAHQLIRKDSVGSKAWKKADWNELSKNFSAMRSDMIELNLPLRKSVSAWKFVDDTAPRLSHQKKPSFVSSRYERTFERQIVRMIESYSSDIRDDWIEQYQRDKLSFESLEQFAMVKLSEINAVSSKDQLSVFTVAIACDILEEIAAEHPIYSRLLNRITLEIYRALYVDFWDITYRDLADSDQFLKFGMKRFAQAVPHFTVVRKYNAEFHSMKEMAIQDMQRTLRGAIKIRDRMKSKMQTSHTLEQHFRAWADFTRHRNVEIQIGVNKLRHVKAAIRSRGKAHFFQAWKKFRHISIQEKLRYEAKTLKKNAVESKKRQLILLREVEHLKERISRLQIGPTDADTNKSDVVDGIIGLRVEELRRLRTEFYHLLNEKIVNPKFLRDDSNNSALHSNISDEDIVLKWLKYQLEFYQYDAVDANEIKNFNGEFFENKEHMEKLLHLFFDSNDDEDNNSESVRIDVKKPKGLIEKLNNEKSVKEIKEVLSLYREHLDEDYSLQHIINTTTLSENNPVANFALLSKLVLTRLNITLSKDDILEDLKLITDKLAICRSIINDDKEKPNLERHFELSTELQGIVKTLNQNLERLRGNNFLWVRFEKNLQNKLFDMSHGYNINQPVYIQYHDEVAMFNSSIENADYEYLSLAVKRRENIDPDESPENEVLIRERCDDTIRTMKKYSSRLLPLLKHFGFKDNIIATQSWMLLCKWCKLATKKIKNSNLEEYFVCIARGDIVMCERLIDAKRHANKNSTFMTKGAHYREVRDARTKHLKVIQTRRYVIETITGGELFCLLTIIADLKFKAPVSTQKCLELLIEEILNYGQYALNVSKMITPPIVDQLIAEHEIKMAAIWSFVLQKYQKGSKKSIRLNASAMASFAKDMLAQCDKQSVMLTKIYMETNKEGKVLNFYQFSKIICLIAMILKPDVHIPIHVRLGSCVADLHEIALTTRR